jgi:hypothetical protein
MLFTLLCALFAFAAIEPNFHFSYQPNEAPSIPCAMERIRDLPDWLVTCEERGRKKVFVAHVILRETLREQDASLEILFWVTDRNQSTPKFTSGTSLIHLKQRSALALVTLSQGVENDSAQLVLQWSATH